MLKLIKSAFLNTLIVFLAEFVALILLATLVYVNKLSPEGFRKYEPFYLSGIYFFTGFFLIRQNLPIKDIKRYLLFFSFLLAGHLINLAVFKLNFNSNAALLLMLYSFCGLAGILVREKSFSVKKYVVTVLILVSSLLVLTPFLPLLKSVRHEETLIEYIKNGVEISEEIIKNSQAAGERRGEEDETQKLLMKIILQQRGKEGSCTRIRAMTKSFPEEAKKVEGNQTDSSSSGGKKSRFSLVSTIEWRIGSIPEIAKKGGRTAEVTERFFRENREPAVINGIENFSCENDGFTSDAGCWEQVDGQYIKAKNALNRRWNNPTSLFQNRFWILKRTWFLFISSGTAVICAHGNRFWFTN